MSVYLKNEELETKLKKLKFPYKEIHMGNLNEAIRNHFKDRNKGQDIISTLMVESLAKKWIELVSK